MLFFIGLIIMFFFTVSPEIRITQAAQWNINLIAVILIPIVLFLLKPKESELRIFFGFTKKFNILDHLGVGFLIGLIITMFVAVMVGGLSAVYNLFGSVAFNFLSSITNEGVLWTVLVQPITESIFLVVMLLFLKDSFERAKIPMPSVIAIIITMIFFSSLHFAVIGRQSFEYSFSGFFDFIVSPNGAFPQLLMGLFWSVLALGFRSFMIPVSAHVMNNWLAVYFSGFIPSSQIILLNFIGLFILVTVVIVIMRNQLAFINEFKLERVFEDA